MGPINQNFVRTLDTVDFPPLSPDAHGGKATRLQARSSWILQHWPTRINGFVRTFVPPAPYLVCEPAKFTMVLGFWFSLLLSMVILGEL